MIDPSQDGVTHINIYSKAATPLGRYLSNFADCNIETKDGPFRTIEGYWYWLAVRDDRLRKTSGWDSKKLGRELRAPDWPKTRGFQEKILSAIAIKVQDPKCVQMLLESKQLPFYHYYVSQSGMAIMPKDGLWMISFIQQFRDELYRFR